MIWYSVPGSSRVMAVCRTDAFPSGARSVKRGGCAPIELVPRAGLEPAP